MWQRAGIESRKLLAKTGYQCTVAGREAGADALHRRVGNRRLGRRAQDFRAGGADQAVGIARERAQVDFAHARIDGGQDVVALPLHRQHRQRGHRQHRPVERQGQALHQGDGQAHAGEGAGAAADGDAVDLRLGQAGFGQQFIGPGQHQLGMPARRQFVAREHLAVGVHGDGAGFGAGFDGQELHGVDCAASGAVSASAKKRCTSSMSRVRGNGGRLARKLRP